MTQRKFSCDGNDAINGDDKLRTVLLAHTMHTAVGACTPTLPKYARLVSATSRVHRCSKRTTLSHNVVQVEVPTSFFNCVSHFVHQLRVKCCMGWSERHCEHQKDSGFSPSVCQHYLSRYYLADALCLKGIFDIDFHCSMSLLVLSVTHLRWKYNTKETVFTKSTHNQMKSSFPVCRKQIHAPIYTCELRCVPQNVPWHTPTTVVSGFQDVPWYSQRYQNHLSRCIS